MGRHGELAEVRRLMEGGRLLTLTGPGGVGKSRLAIQAGTLARRAFPDGVWLVELAALQDAQRVPDTVADALQIKDQSVRLAKEQLADHLASRQLLMILDNCEHLLVACAELVDCLLRRSQRLHILCTSRQPLNLPGERVLVVQPFPVPSVEHTPATEFLSKFEAVVLLVDRASAVQPGFEVDENNRRAIARLCRRLDGLPLAIELAATRLRSMAVQQVADRLDNRFELLSRGNPAALSRQQTLRALIDWSYHLCTEQERLLWARLSIFPGDFDLGAAEGICAGDGIVAEQMFDVLDDLVAKSVVVTRHDHPTPRFRLLETIRQYGRELLERSGDEARLRRQHRDYFLALAQRGCRDWCGPEQAEILRRFRLEQDNFGAAFDWSLADPGEQISALALLSALRYHWTLGGFLSTGRRLFDQALDSVEDSTVERGDALWVAAWIALLQGDHTAAARWLHECDFIARASGNDHLQGYALLLSGTANLFSGRASAAVRFFHAALVRMRRHGDTAATLWGLFQYSVALSHVGDHAGAQNACEDAIGIAEQRGELWARSEAMWARTLDQWLAGGESGTVAEPRVIREALAVTPNANDVSTVLGVELLAWIAASQTEFENAARLLGAASALWTSFGTTINAFGPLFSGHSTACRDAAIKALGGPRFDELHDVGRARPLEIAGISDTPMAPTDTASGPRLTRREREVAQLITEGLTNKAIAARLVLSPRTVEGHIERVFAKIGVDSRAQVAVWMAQHEAQTHGAKT